MEEITKIRFEKAGPEAILGPLEAKVLSTLWNKKSATVRDLYTIIHREQPIALTSIAVMLDRLHKKKLASRTISLGRGGRHYIYTPTLSRQAFEYTALDTIVSKLLDTFGPAAVAYFNNRFSAQKK